MTLAPRFIGRPRWLCGPVLASPGPLGTGVAVAIGVLGGAWMDVRGRSCGAGTSRGTRGRALDGRCALGLCGVLARLLELQLQGLGDQATHPLRIEPGRGAGGANKGEGTAHAQVPIELAQMAG